MQSNPTYQVNHLQVELIQIEKFKINKYNSIQIEV